MSNRFSDYDGFARAYNRHWGPKAGDTQLPVLHDLLLPRLPANLCAIVNLPSSENPCRAPLAVLGLTSRRGLSYPCP